MHMISLTKIEVFSNHRGKKVFHHLNCYPPNSSWPNLRDFQILLVSHLLCDFPAMNCKNAHNKYKGLHNVVQTLRNQVINRNWENEH